MKFGEHLAARLTPEWNSQYIKYEYMKELLGRALIQAPDTMGDGDDTLRNQFFKDFDISFFQVRLI